MRISRSSKWITVLLSVLSLVSIASTLFSFELLAQRRSVNDSLLKALVAAEQLTRGSDELTSAIRGYAATGDSQYWYDYTNELTVNRSRDRALAELYTLDLRVSEIASFVQAMAASNGLVNLENQAAAEVARGDLKKAVALVYGPEYAHEKSAILSPIHTASVAIEDRLTQERDALTSWAAAIQVIAVAATAINVLAIVGSLLFFFQRRVIFPIVRLTTLTKQLVAGDREVRFGHEGDHSEIGELAATLEASRIADERFERQRWVKDGLTEIAAALQVAEDLETLGDRVVALLAPRLGCGSAQISFRDPLTGRLSCIGTYGLGEGVCHDLEADQGLVAEALRGGQPIVVTDLPADYPKIKSSLGEASPREVVLIPVLSGATALAVVELATFAPLSGPRWELATELSAILAPRLEVLVRTLRTRQLLEETKAQASQLADQAEQMKRLFSEQQAILDSANAGVVMIRSRVIQRCNQQADEIFGWPSGAQVGRSTRIWFPDEQSFVELGAASDEAIRQDWTFRRVQRMVRRDGSRFWARLTSRSLAKNDPSQGLVVMVEDITAEREVNEALLAAKETAEAATQAKSAFLANMSHEIRTPMNAVLGMAHLALKTDLTPRQKDYLTKIESSGKHLLGIINDILDFSKIEAGKLSLENAPFNLETTLQTVAGFLGQKATDKGLELLFDIAPDVPRNLVGDSLRLGQILLNLGTNAVKFTEAGEIKLSARVQEQTVDGALLWFGVKDTGIGLTEGQAELLFQSFQQADMSTTRQFGGTGLGLAICKKLAELMGGAVGVQSQADAGSEF